MSNKLVSTKKEWKALARHSKKASGVSIASLFSHDPQRFETFHAEAAGCLFDYSKQNVTAETVELLIALARACDVEPWRDQMFAGHKINISEDRAVLHTDLRRPDAPAIVRQTLEKMQIFSDNVRGSTITDIVNIGIGGSNLGPHFVSDALKAYADGPRVHFVSNVDGSHLSHTLKNLQPETTLFIIASKTFATQETMVNAKSAKEWAGTKSRFAAVTANIHAAQLFGISEDHIFPMWDWVGGRYSVWSAIGLPVMIALGSAHFRAFLKGAYDADRHFLDTPLQQNIPVLMAMIGVWHRNFCQRGAFAILPYAQDLKLLPPWLQQLDMESNGKNHDRQGQRVDYATSPVVFGEPGTNGQHAFYQMLHQGTDIVPCDFIVPVSITGSSPDHQLKLLANAIGQSEALMEEQLSDQPWKIFEGNRPSSTLMLPRLDPYYLGFLMALYEHKVFVQGIVWNLNSFDQWGVEFGKDVSKNIESSLKSGQNDEDDSSTQGLLRYILGRQS